MNYLFKRKRDRYFLVLDIDTDSVNTLIYEKENKKNIILATYFEEFKKFGVFDSSLENFDTNIKKKAISNSINEVKKKVNRIPELSLVALPPDILRARILWQSYKRENQKKIINRREEEEIYNIVLKRAKREVCRQYAERFGILPKELQFLNLEVLERKINGYEVPSFLGFSGKCLDLKILVSFGIKSSLKEFEDIFKSLKLGNIKILHLVQKLQNFIEGQQDKDFVFLNIRRRLTQIFLTNKGKLVYVDEFKPGSNIFSFAVSQQWGLDAQRAEFLIQRYINSELSEEVRERLKEKFYPLAQYWFTNLNKKLIEKKLLIKNIYLSGEGSLIPEIQEVLEKENEEKDSLFIRPEIKIVYPKDLTDFEDKTSELNNPKDVSLLLLCYHR